MSSSYAEACGVCGGPVEKGADGVPYHVTTDGESNNGADRDHDPT